jgi:gas vesicle protein
MKRLAMGAALGALTAYLGDPNLGAERRQRLMSMWQDNRESAVQAGQKASQAFESARPVARRVTQAIGSRDLAKLLERRRSSGTLPKLIGAAAVGGALMYFLDPVRGPERRRSVVAKGRQAAAKAVDAAKKARSRAGGASAEPGNRVKSEVG